MSSSSTEPGQPAERRWLACTLVTMLAWGLWGALIDLTAQGGFPEEMGYIVWALTMIPPAVIAIGRVGWRIDFNLTAISLGLAVGLLGAGGQLVLFKILRLAPAYLVFPIVALSPVVTIVMGLTLLRERVGARAGVGIVLALGAGALLAVSPADGQVAGEGWVVLTLGVFLAWGVQGYLISFANRKMSAESIFFFMALAGLMLAPVAARMVDFHAPINWGLDGFFAAVAIQSLNSIGALLLVYAFRHGQAMVVAPLVNAGSPMITILLSLALSQVWPNGYNLFGMILAVLAVLLLS